MPAFSASAPGKAILFGEHAVVYGRPAIAVPVTQVQAHAVVMPDPSLQRGEFLISAPDVHLDCRIGDLPAGHGFRRLFEALAEYYKMDHFPSARLRITSTVPMEAGLGSGAAVSVAVIRAVSAYLGRRLDDSVVSALAYEVEKIYHGNPSGIDNTVITYARPIYFTRGQPFELLYPAEPLFLVIADTGKASSTAEVVGDVRRHWLEEPDAYNIRFDAIGSIVHRARLCIEQGLMQELGSLMDLNQGILQELDVSSPELDNLISAARSAGALGAKLSGAGRGGNMIALVRPSEGSLVAAALENAGAVQIYVSQIIPNLSRGE